MDNKDINPFHFVFNLEILGSLLYLHNRESEDTFNLRKNHLRLSQSAETYLKILERVKWNAFAYKYNYNPN